MQFCSLGSVESLNVSVVTSYRLRYGDVYLRFVALQQAFLLPRKLLFGKLQGPTTAE